MGKSPALKQGSLCFCRPNYQTTQGIDASNAREAKIQAIPQSGAEMRVFRSRALFRFALEAFAHESPYHKNGHKKSNGRESAREGYAPRPFKEDSHDLFRLEITVAQAAIILCKRG
jgi:hypothetical protein